MRIAAFLGLSLASVHQAQAQEFNDDKNFGLRLSMASAYDTNELRVSDSQAGLPGLEKADFSITPAIQIDATAPIGRQSVYVAGSLGYSFHQRNKQLDRERINLTSGVTLSAGPGCTGNASFGYSRQQTDFAEFRQFVQTNNTSETRNTTTNASCGAVIGLRPSVGFDHSVASNSNTARSISNYKSDTIRGSIAYTRPSLGDLSIYGSYRIGKYPNRLAFVATPTSEKIEVFSGGVSFSRNIGASVKGAVSLGYTKVDPNVPGVRPYGGSSYSADITWRPNDRLNFGLGASKSVQQSSTLDISYSIARSYVVNGGYAASERIRFRFGAGYSKQDYRESPLLPMIGGRSKESGVYVSGGVSYKPPGRITFGLDLRGSHRNSDNRQFDYGNMVGTLTVRYGF